MYGCVSRQDQVTDVACRALCCDADQAHTLRAAEWDGSVEPTRKGAAAEQRLLCQTGAEQGDFVCFAHRHEERVSLLESQRSFAGGRSSNSIAAFSEF